MHVLCGVRRKCPGWDLSELRRQSGGASDPAFSLVGERSGFDKAGLALGALR
jgi:hypothetical protein